MKKIILSLMLVLPAAYSEEICLVRQPYTGNGIQAEINQKLKEGWTVKHIAGAGGGAGGAIEVYFVIILFRPDSKPVKPVVSVFDDDEYGTYKSEPKKASVSNNEYGSF